MWKKKTKISINCAIKFSLADRNVPDWVEALDSYIDHTIHLDGRKIRHQDQKSRSSPYLLKMKENRKWIWQLS